MAQSERGKSDMRKGVSKLDSDLLITYCPVHMSAVIKHNASGVRLEVTVSSISDDIRQVPSMVKWSSSNTISLCASYIIIRGRLHRSDCGSQ